MHEYLNLALLIAAIVLLVVAAWLPLRLLQCLFSARTRAAVRKRWLLHSVWGLCSVAYLGLAVLTALPSPNYTTRVKVNEGLGLADVARTGVNAHWRDHGALPQSNAEAGLAAPDELGGVYVGSVTVAAGGVITVRYVTTAALPHEARGRTIVLVPQVADGALRWDCTSGDLPVQHRPAACRP